MATCEPVLVLVIEHSCVCTNYSIEDTWPFSVTLGISFRFSVSAKSTNGMIPIPTFNQIIHKNKNHAKLSQLQAKKS